ncbi:CRAL-TRIO lipid binding domain [Fusarium oxysporum f. sp. vasinfectum]|nr:CRAL-TRIO lipid binding domain [Fusarium oxysporum f. sp. vasinfectum]
MAAEQEKTVPAAVPAENPATPEAPLTKLNARLEDIFSKTLHKEMWGVQLTNIDHVPTKVVLQKFLRANNDDPVAAEKQLTQALEWRKKMNPTALVTQTFDKSKFGDLGYVTVHKGENGKETIITWNIYGAVKDNKATFGNVEEFIKWRAAIMELSVQKLKLDQVTEPIPEGGEDPYQMIQVHDYLNVSFFRMDPAVKAASKETISVFSMAYPELLAHKYFVNVPAIMGWMFGAMKLFLTPATLRKFHPMTSGTTLATELKGIVSTLPKEYGGQGASVKEGMSVSLTEAGESASGETSAEPSPTEVPEQTAAADSTTAEKTVVTRESAPATEKTLTAEPIAVEQAGEKPIEEALEKLSVNPAESEKKDTLATDVEKKETAA